jgi:hypothetical protein
MGENITNETLIKSSNQWEYLASIVDTLPWNINEWWCFSHGKRKTRIGYRHQPFVYLSLTPSCTNLGVRWPKYDWKVEDEPENHMQTKGIKRIEFGRI